jgi:hypothetical protein
VDAVADDPDVKVASSPLGAIGAELDVHDPVGVLEGVV